MPELIHCTSCGRQLQLPDSLIGQTVQCPSCQATFVATPRGGGAAPPSPGPGYPVPEGPPGSAREDYRQPRRRRNDDHGDDYGDDYDDYPRRPRRGRGYDARPHRGSGVLTLGILSLVFSLCPLIGFILGLIGLIMGNTDLAAIDSGEMDPEGRGSTSAGRTCALIGMILSGVFFVFGLMINLSRIR